jgi:hypothetical protein
MSAKFKVLAVAGLLSFTLADSAFAFVWDCPPVPEFDGTSGIAAISLLLSVAAVLFSKSRSR